MGIVRNILVFCLLLAINFSLAQGVNDTIIFDNEIFVKHIVQAGESINSIAKLHEVTVNDIISNNEIQKRLYYNQLLYIPLININKASFLFNEIANTQYFQADTSITNIALLLPYYLIKNDTMFNEYEDLGKSSGIYYNQSEAALSFHIGVELAIDSLMQNGKKIILHAFDTNRDSLAVKKLVYSKKLNDMDIIIGPMYSKFFKMLCKRYGDDSTKILIC